MCVHVRVCVFVLKRQMVSASKGDDVRNENKANIFKSSYLVRVGIMCVCMYACVFVRMLACVP